MENTQYLSPIQQQFFSQDLCKVEIIPLNKIERLQMIIDNYGPYEEGIKYSIPLWLAVHFKQIGLCKLVIPHWLSLEELKETLEEEQNNDDFTPLPYYYQEITYALMKYASDDFIDLDDVRGVFEDIRYCRMEKLRAGLRTINEESETIILTNVGASEITLLRGCIKRLFNSITSLSNAVDKAENIDYSHNLRNMNAQSQ
ncbi:DNA replication complex GINS protein PSF2, putative [Entamoeba dispar SAW760]|uniref:DNA replication complex GINS protein PSF2, putative n=1 Tax=Entamoeba dispar (strain ATCC PRA-260 / SAW760) TaxID=370354 RepID=B0ECW0_ENTDS|nr:DNA replication complex GINS protein PSF2, putative [Entamoeba dispar SAW760]EDR27652.1 DNA replication complex GINS protein PSF2, putative [Entamoeba dispar SAW760]|eukprot:EDR27652.1 DNA replication complex GINS protein PSF2, putative [Entamoeba dispar SAW760]